MSGLRQVLKRVPGVVPLVRQTRRAWTRLRWHHFRGLFHGYPPDSDFYQAPDWWVVDYELYSPPHLPRELSPGLPLRLRGPAPRDRTPGSFIACVGAAQTFGRFCAEPFPALLSRNLELPTLNLGFGGADPQLFLRHPELIQSMNDSALVILQVMSARNQDNSLFEGGGWGSLKSRRDGHRLRAEDAYESLLASGDRALLHKVVRETRETWVASYKRLLSRIRVQTVLLWFSVRTPDYAENYESVGELFGPFPHLVNQAMVESVAFHCDAYVECVSSRGHPQELRSRFSGRPTRVVVPDGQPWRENSYYPSPAMHKDAAALLTPICRQFLNHRRGEL